MGHSSYCPYNYCMIFFTFFERILWGIESSCVSVCVCLHLFILALVNFMQEANFVSIMICLWCQFCCLCELWLGRKASSTVEWRAELVARARLCTCEFAFLVFHGSLDIRKIIEKPIKRQWGPIQKCISNWTYHFWCVRMCETHLNKNVCRKPSLIQPLQKRCCSLDWNYTSLCDIPHVFLVIFFFASLMLKGRSLQFFQRVCEWNKARRRHWYV